MPVIGALWLDAIGYHDDAYMAATGVSGLRFTVRYPEGRVEVLTVDSDKVLVGSGAHCEIRLPAEHAAVEHMEVTMSLGGANAQARAADRLPTINGVEFMQSPVMADSVVAIGACQLTIEVVEIEDNPDVIKKKQEKTSPLTYLLALVAIPLAAYVLLFEDDGRIENKIPTDVPELWAKPQTSCPVDAADQAIVLAAEKFVVAEGKAERRPFRVQDGVAAVPLYEVASACFRTGGDEARSVEVSATAASLRKKVGEDYRAHRVRLEHALAVRDLATAHKEVKVLRAFTEGAAGNYVVWLGNLDRQLQLKLGEKKS
ncbi:MAG: hypothetical protein JNL79_25165 [Myxococcales bacterium]|nr:hypothetical protein [Myxococcales bacterium]